MNSSTTPFLFSSFSYNTDLYTSLDSLTSQALLSSCPLVFSTLQPTGSSSSVYPKLSSLFPQTCLSPVLDDNTHILKQSPCKVLLPWCLMNLSVLSTHALKRLLNRFLLVFLSSGLYIKSHSRNLLVVALPALFFLQY